MDSQVAPIFNVADEAFWIFNDERVLEWVTVFVSGIPKWQKVKWNRSGAYIITPDKKRYFVLVNN